MSVTGCGPTDQPCETLGRLLFFPGGSNSVSGTCLAHNTWAASDQRGHRNLRSPCRKSAALPHGHASSCPGRHRRGWPGTGVARGQATPQCPAGMPDLPRGPSLAPHQPGGEVLKPNLPDQFPFQGHRNMGLPPRAPFGESLVPSGRTWSAGFRKSQGVYFAFSLFLSERCMTNPRSQAPWCCGTTLVFGVLETPFVSHVCTSR